MATCLTFKINHISQNKMNDTNKIYKYVRVEHTKTKSGEILKAIS